MFPGYSLINADRLSALALLQGVLRASSVIGESTLSALTSNSKDADAPLLTEDYLKMSTTIPFSLVSNPQLLDVVDEQWMQDKLEDDGELCCLGQFRSC